MINLFSIDKIAFTIFCFCSFGCYAQRIDYTYDKLHRIVIVSLSEKGVYSFGYDNNGNRKFQNSVGNISVYHFIGNGSWSIPSNWHNNIIPPLELPVGSEIIIDPFPDGECILDVNQKIMIGAKIRVMAGKKLRIPANINFQ